MSYNINSYFEKDIIIQGHREESFSEGESFPKKNWDVANACLSGRKRIKSENIKLNIAVAECALHQLRCERRSSWPLHQLKRIGTIIKPLTAFFAI